MASEEGAVRDLSLVDDETLGVIITLQREEVENARPGTDDEALALQLYSEELNNAAMVLQDRNMALALGDDDQEAEEHIIMDDNAQEPGDHMAMSDDDSDHDSSMIDTFTVWEGDSEPAEAEQRACLCCREMVNVDQLVLPGCNHAYCRPCLRVMFTLAATDGYLAHCCGIIPLEVGEQYLNDDQIGPYRAMFAELSAENRTYCHVDKCFTFIAADTHDGNTATCAKCGANTCTACKGPTHDGDCPRDEELEKVREYVREQGWKECPRCRTGIELNMGCYHVS